MKFTQKYFSLLILFGMGLAFVWPEPGLWIKPYLVYLLGAMMTFSCLKINLKELINVKKEWSRYLIIMAIIFLLPATLTFLAHLFILKNNEIYIGMMLGATVPCGIAIVFITDLLGGYASKALVTTTLAHLISPVITPFIFWLFVHEIINVDFSSMIILIFKLVIIPLLIAEIISRFKWKDKIARAGSAINTYLLLILLWGIMSPVKDIILENLKLSLCAIAITLIIMFIIALVAKRLGHDKKEDITWMVAGTFKNFTLASVIALSLFGQMALLGSAVYGIVSNLVIIPLQIIYKQK